MAVQGHDALASTSARARRNRLVLIGLFALAFVPLIGAYLLYEGVRSSEPWGTTNRGQLMTPIRQVGEFNLTSDDPGMSMDESGTWWLVTVASPTCAGPCEAALHQLRQLHVLLGKDAERVKRALIERDSEGPDPQLVEQYPELVRFTSSDGGLDDGIYIVDPLGNVVLHYPYADAGKPVLEDMKKLLKVSHIG